MDNSPEPGPEPPNLRFLRLLVTVLTGVMIVGLLTIIGLFVMRFGTVSQAPDLSGASLLPERLALPDGTTASAITYTDTHIVIVTTDQQVLVYDLEGQLLSEILLDTPPASTSD